MLKIIYPETRNVDEQTVINWAWDYASDHMLDFDGSLPEAMALLEDFGLVTFVVGNGKEV